MEISSLRGVFEAWYFEDEADELTDLVVKGIKTATYSAFEYFKASGHAIPKEGDHIVILDSKEDAVCIIRLNRVHVAPFFAKPRKNTLAKRPRGMARCRAGEMPMWNFSPSCWGNREGIQRANRTSP